MNQPLSLLIVEDNESYSYVTERVLREIDPALVTRVAQTAEQAMQFVAQARPDLVLLDLVIPNTSGLELLRTLKHDAATVGIPVVVLTAYDDDRNVWQSYHRYANAYLVKPGSFEQLREALGALYDFWCRHVLFPRGLHHAAPE